MLKKVTLGLIALGVSASALAAGPGADVPIPAAPASINVTAPVQHSSWEIGLEAQYVEATGSDMVYAQILKGGGGTGDSAGPKHKNLEVEPGYAWLGHGDITFNIPGNGRYVQLGFSYLNSDDIDRSDVNDENGHNKLIGTPANNAIFNQTDFGVKAQPASLSDIKVVKGKAEWSYTDVDLVFGQKIDVGHRVRLKFWGGLRYADIDAEGKINAAGFSTSAQTTTRFSDVAKMSSEFSGLGPRAGIDTQVNLGYGFAFVGRVAGSLLIGDIESKMMINNIAKGSSGSITKSAAGGIKNDSQTTVVPEADMRIGLHYNYGFNPSTSLGLEVGYQAVNYFDAVEKDMIDSVIPNTHISRSDWGYHGPYLRAQINIA